MSGILDNKSRLLKIVSTITATTIALYFIGTVIKNVSLVATAFIITTLACCQAVFGVVASASVIASGWMIGSMINKLYDRCDRVPNNAIESYVAGYSIFHQNKRMTLDCSIIIGSMMLCALVASSLGMIGVFALSITYGTCFVSANNALVDKTMEFIYNAACGIGVNAYKTVGKSTELICDSIKQVCASVSESCDYVNESNKRYFGL